MSIGEQRSIDHVSQGGPILNGEFIEFDLRLENGEVEQFRCAHEKLPKLIHGLKQFGEMAEHLRRAGPGPSSEVVSPYQASSIKVGRNLDSSLVVLQIRTAEGAPLMISIPTKLALAMVESVIRTIESGRNIQDQRF